MRGWALALLAALLAGCFDAGGAAGLPRETQSPSLVATIGGDDRSTAAPPQWATGEWWRYRVDASGHKYEFTRVVVGREGSFYLVGVPKEEHNVVIIGKHVPGLGEVRVEDLAYEVHDEFFPLVEFPLTVGKTWRTWFEWGYMNMTVVEVNASHALIRSDGVPGGNGRRDFVTEAEYDAVLGEFRRIQIQGYGVFEIVDHGFGWNGTVRVPRHQDVVFWVGRAVGVAPVGRSPVPVDYAVVGGQYDQIDLVLGVGNLTTGTTMNRSAPGIFREYVRAPNGKEYEAARAPPDSSFRFIHFQHDRPVGGQWQFQHVAIGVGLAQTEGFAYQVYDITVPGLQVTRPLGPR